MPKQKTRKSVAKRFKKTASGKYKRKTSGRRHLLSGKSPKRRRQLRNDPMLSKADSNRVKSQIAE